MVIIYLRALSIILLKPPDSITKHKKTADEKEDTPHQIQIKERSNSSKGKMIQIPLSSSPKVAPLDNKGTPAKFHIEGKLEELTKSRRWHLKYMKLTKSEKYPVLYQCTICDHALTREYSLRLHLLSHFNLKRHQCDVCHKRYSSRQYLLGHMRMHRESGPLRCPDAKCTKTFSHSMKLARHCRVYSHGHGHASVTDETEYFNRENDLQMGRNSSTSVELDGKVFEITTPHQQEDATTTDLIARRLTQFDVDGHVTRSLLAPWTLTSIQQMGWSDCEQSPFVSAINWIRP
mmetsp:Transcript_47962/g.55269  ORF Transcript_47962/g.55269 Transcript_47962/m.55269 type:complete len:290 (+) Transcript_47962:244-1113(+)